MDCELDAGKQIASLAATMLEAINCNDLHRARLLVQGISTENRRQLTRPVHGVTDKGFLFIAIETQNLGFVDFLVTECCADLEEKVELRRPLDSDFYTPLAYSVLFGLNEIVQRLFQLGANIQFVTPNAGKTLAHLAVQSRKLEIIKLLHENGVDLRPANRAGRTALMYAWDSLDVSRYLVEHGVDVNAADITMNTALNYAVGQDQYRVVEFLLENGADPFRTNSSDYNAIELAARHRASNCLALFGKKVISGDDRVIDILQLFGAHCADLYGDTERAIGLWKHALRIRHGLNQMGYETAPLAMKPRPAYDMAVEIDTEDELLEIRNDHNAIIMQALLLKEKILGRQHLGHILEVLRRASTYFNSGDPSRALRLLARVFKLATDYYLGREGASAEYATLANKIRKVYSAQVTRKLSTVKNQLNPSDLLYFLEAASEWTIRVYRERTEEFREMVMCPLMTLMLHLIHMLCHIQLDDADSFQFRKTVYKALRSDIRDQEDKTLLIKSTELSFDNAFSSEVIRVLLECGAKVHEVDFYGNTVLHILEQIADEVKKDSSSSEVNRLTEKELKQAAHLLVSNGAHFDARNSEGSDSISYAASVGINVGAHMSLKCLAARAIQTHRIPYKGHVPTSLDDFVAMH